MSSQKHSFLHFQSFEKYIENAIPVHEKIGQEWVFFQCWLNRWNAIFRCLPEKWQAPGFFSESQTILENTYLTKNIDNGEKNEQCVFSDRFEAAVIQLPQKEAFYQKGPTPGSQRHVSWLFQSFAKIYLGYCAYHFIRKDVRESVLCVLNTLPVVTRIR